MGTSAALLTPFDRRGEVVEEQLRGHVEWLIGKGIDGLYVCGNSGQGVYLSGPDKLKYQRIRTPNIERPTPDVEVGKTRRQRPARGTLTDANSLTACVPPSETARLLEALRQIVAACPLAIRLEA